MLSGAKILGIVLVIIGLFYLAVPHDVHVSSGMGFGLEHMYHMALGAVLVVIGLLIIFMGKRKKAPAQAKLGK